MSEHTPTPWIEGPYPGHVMSDKTRLVANCRGYTSSTCPQDVARENDANARRISACVNAFHSPDGRKIATEDIAEGMVFRLYDALAALVTDTQEALREFDTDSADPLNEVPTIKNARALLSNLKIERPGE